jgi:hypothetical protein
MLLELAVGRWTLERSTKHAMATWLLTQEQLGLGEDIAAEFAFQRHGWNTWDVYCKLYTQGGVLHVYLLTDFKELKKRRESLGQQVPENYVSYEEACQTFPEIGLDDLLADAQRTFTALTRIVEM